MLESICPSLALSAVITRKTLLLLPFLCFAALLFARVSWAQGNGQPPGAPTALLTDSSEEFSLAANMELLRDDTGKLTLQDVMSPPYANQFIPNGNKLPTLGINGSTDWVRLRVQNESARNDWLMQVMDSRIAYVEFYRPMAGTSGYEAIRTGDYLPFSTREIPDRFFVFALPIARDTEQTVFLRVQSPFAVDLPLVILDKDVLFAHTRSDLFDYGLFYGAMLMMAGYNLFVFWSLRDRVYLYLAVVILGLALSKAAQDGLGHEYLWSQISNRWTMEYSIIITILATSIFTTTFLDLPKRAARLNQIFNSWRMVVLITAVVVPLFTTLPLLAALIGIEIVLILTSILRAWQSGYTPARLFLVSWIGALLTALVYVLYSLGALPSPYSSDRALLLGLASLALFWSFVVADRITLMRAEAQAANRSLARSERQYRSLFQDSLDAIFIMTREGGIVDLNPSGLDLFGYTRSEVLNMRAEQLFANPDTYQQLQQKLEQEGFVADYEAQLRCQNDSVITAIISSTSWRDEEHGLSGYQGILRDVTERRRTQEELATYRLHLEELVAARTTQANAELVERRRAEAALEQRVQALSTLNEIAKTISSVTDLLPALNLVARQVTRLFDASGAVIGEMDQATQSFHVLAHYPQAAEMVPPLAYTLAWEDAPIFQVVREHNKIVYIPDAHTNPLVGKAHQLVPHSECRTLLWVPLRVSGVLNGMLILSSTRRDTFAQDETLNLGETVGSAIATALENTRLYQQAQATAVAHERQRLARELHDSVTQLLYSIVLLAGGRGVEAEQGGVDNKTLGQYFNELGELGQQALGEMRLLLYQLRAPLLGEIGLSGALKQRLSAVEQRVGIQTHIYTHGDLETLPLLAQEELYFIAQEALNNALRHARASEIQIRLVKQNHHLELVVQDNGNGFEQGQISEGMGLRNMYARAQLIDAKIEIQSFPGQGTRVQLGMEFPEYDSE